MNNQINQEDIKHITEMFQTYGIEEEEFPESEKEIIIFILEGVGFKNPTLLFNSRCNEIDHSSLMISQRIGKNSKFVKMTNGKFKIKENIVKELEEQSKERMKLLDPVGVSTSSLIYKPLKFLNEKLLKNEQEMVLNGTSKKNTIQKMIILAKLVLVQMLRQGSIVVNEFLIPFNKLIWSTVAVAAVTVGISSVLGVGLGGIGGFVAGTTISLVGGIPFTIIATIPIIVKTVIKLFKEVWRKDNGLRGVDFTPMFLGMLFIPPLFTAVKIPYILFAAILPVLTKLLIGFVKGLLKGKYVIKKKPSLSEAKEILINLLVDGPSALFNKIKGKLLTKERIIEGNYQYPSKPHLYNDYLLQTFQKKHLKDMFLSSIQDELRNDVITYSIIMKNKNKSLFDLKLVAFTETGVLKILNADATSLRTISYE